MKTRNLWPTAIFLLTPLVSFAQEATLDKELETIVVYGVRLDQTVAEVGSSVTIITADEIETLGLDFAIDVLALAPGVTINQNGAFGGSASIRIRGAASEQTLVIIDGVVANDPTSPGGGFDFARLDTANIERIEILKGPQSTLWGSDAIGGVINIITKRPEQGFAGKAFLEAGSFSSLRGGAEIGGANDRYDFRLSAIGSTSDGISKADENNGNTEKDGFDSKTVNGRGGIKLWGDARLDASFLWNDAEAEFDSFSYGAEGNVGDGDEVSETTELVGNITLDVPAFDGKLDNFLLVGYTDIERNSFTDGLPGFSSEGDRLTLRYQGSISVNERNRIAFGAEQEDSEANGDDTTIRGLFGLYEWKPTTSLTLSAGLRRDDHERYGGETTGRLALAYNPNEQVTMRGSWGEGFKAPSIFQTTFFCCGAEEPNADLRPETSDAFDTGITLRTSDGRGEIELTYFNQDTTDLIDFSFTVGGYENIAEAKTSGIELFGRYRVSQWGELTAEYTYIDARDGMGDDLPRVPAHSGNVTFIYDPAGPLSGSAVLRYNGKEQDPNGSVDAWTRVDLSARYRFNERFEIYTRIENLLDEQYQQVLGYGTPGLSGYVGGQLRF
ncbi:MAG: TonB-dependent receptor [Gammaproteobacteria bacterium]|nr:TonB-dependent receptor [Gammaproteobacteria bacterium]